MNTNESIEPSGESLGRIEVAPEVIATIAYFATLRVPGISQIGTPPSNLFRRVTARRDGVLLSLENGELVFDIYIWIRSGINMMETSHALQEAVIEAMDTMVGMPVAAVNVHVDNVSTDTIESNE